MEATGPRHPVALRLLHHVIPAHHVKDFLWWSGQLLRFVRSRANARRLGAVQLSRCVIGSVVETRKTACRPDSGGRHRVLCPTHAQDAERATQAAPTTQRTQSRSEPNHRLTTRVRRVWIPRREAVRQKFRLDCPGADERIRSEWRGCRCGRRRRPIAGERPRRRCRRWPCCGFRGQLRRGLPAIRQ